MKSASNDNLKTDILCVDFWRAGLRVHCLPVHKQLARLRPRITMKAFHRESLYARGEFVPKIDCIEGLECYDISYFPWRRNLERIIRQFNPRIVVILTHSFLFDRSIIRLCRRIGIQTIFLQHGAVSFSLRRDVHKLRLLPAIYLDKARRYLSYYLPVYLRATAPEDPLCVLRPSFLKFLLGSLILNYTFVPPRPTSEIRADRALVYGEVYAEEFKHLHGYQDNQIHVVGNLTFDSLIDVAKRGAIGRETWLRARGLDPSRRTITYLPQPFVEKAYIGKLDFSSQLSMLVNRLTKEGVNIVVKLHPRNRIDFFSTVLNKEMVAIEQTDLVESVYYSDAVVGHSSTALGLAIMAHKPLVVWDIAKASVSLSSELQEFNSVAHVVASLDELNGVLDTISDNDWACDKEELYAEWLRKYSYSNPEEKAVQRITEFVVAEYASERKKH